MITIRKLSKQPSEAIIRKSVQICYFLEQEALRDEQIFLVKHGRYVKELFDLLLANPLVNPYTKELLESFRDSFFSATAPRQRVFMLADLRYALTHTSGYDVGEWDLYSMSGEHKREILPIKVFIDRIRSPFNVGAVFRTAESFGVEEVVLHPASASPLHPRAKRSAMGCIDRIPWRTAYEQEISGEMFALETGGVPVTEFSFPSSATVVVGSEELGVSPELLRISEGSLGRVTIPTAGEKNSLNVSVAFGILMYSWYHAIASKPVR